MNKFNEHQFEWHALQRPAVVFLLCLLMASIIIGIGLHLHKVQNKIYQQAVEQRDDVVNRLQEAQQNKSLYENNIQLYQRYLANGLVGDEARLSWIEALEELRRDLILPSLKYSFEPRRIAEIAESQRINVGGNIGLYITNMQIEASLLHEGDLLTILNKLKNPRLGYYEIISCKLDNHFPLGATLALAGISAPNVLMNCKLKWYTVKINHA
ncbi:MAG: hypothetical protein H0W44_03150 [Gammaproteobacteria bacterium]|nr:hypothetical protein [Gammaproteobacteria bacterium]